MCMYILTGAVFEIATIAQALIRASFANATYSGKGAKHWNTIASRPVLVLELNTTRYMCMIHEQIPVYCFSEQLVRE